MEPDQERFEAWLHSAQPICKSPWVCWQAGLESNEQTKRLAGTPGSEDAFNVWHKAIMAESNDIRLFDAYRAAITWGQQYVGTATFASSSQETNTELDAVRPLRL